MKEFFRVVSISEALGFRDRFGAVGTETVALESSLGRVLASDVACSQDVPHFPRATMDGYALAAASTFGASESGPSLLSVAGTVRMGQAPDFCLGPGQAARIATGGMLPSGADAVVMVEHTDPVDETLVEVYKSVAPLANVISSGDDFKQGEIVLEKGQRLRPQDMALLAAVGKTRVDVFRRPVAGIISTGDEIVPAGDDPAPGKLRDSNAFALLGQCLAAGADPVYFGIAPDDPDGLFAACRRALETSDTLLVSGGSSVGSRDYTVETLERFGGAQVLAHGVSISPGKPTILAQVLGKPVWGLPGHVVSAMIVFEVLVRPFMERLCGARPNSGNGFLLPARLSANVAGKQGRADFVRVRLVPREDGLWAEPVLGKSGEIRTMVAADGLIEIGVNEEGREAGAPVSVRLFRS